MFRVEIQCCKPDVGLLIVFNGRPAPKYIYYAEDTT
jgi:hypothetical protein